MGLSTHYVETRTRRQAFIEEIGLGTLAHRTVEYDERRQRAFIYEISTTAILTVRAYDEPTLIITRYQARPSRIKRYWADAPQSIMRIAMTYSQRGRNF